MMPHEEAAAILIRVLEALARASSKTLNARTRTDIARACELLTSAGLDELEDLPSAPAEPEYIPASAAIPRDWMERKRREERER